MKHFNFISGKDISIVFAKIFFLLIVFVMGYNSLYAQNCKLERIKDDFGYGETFYSKDVTLASVFPLVGSKKPWDLVMSFMLVDGSLSISVTHQSQKYSTSLSSIYFKFQDGTVLKKETPATTGKYNTGLGYSYTYTSFNLTKENLLLFASKDLLKFQADFKYFPDYPIVEEDIKTKSVEKIRKDASCILDELNSAPSAKKEGKNDIKEVVYECKYTKDVKDAFTKKRIVDSNGSTIYDFKEANNRLWLTVVGNNTNGMNGIQLEWGVWSSDKIDKTAAQDALKFSQVDILLENEDIINLTNNELPKFVNQGDYYISYKLFTVNDSIWGKLKTVPFKSLRLTLNNESVFSEEIDKKYTNSFMNVINCIDVLEIPKSK